MDVFSNKQSLFLSTSYLERSRSSKKGRELSNTSDEMLATLESIGSSIYETGYDDRMALIALKCPNCGGDVELDESMRQGFCIYCGTKLINDSESKKIKIDHEDEILGKLKLSLLALKADEKDRFTSLIDDVISLDPKASDAWLMKSLMYDEPLCFDYQKNGMAADCNRYGVFSKEDLPKKARADSYKVVFQLAGVQSNEGKGLFLFIDSKRYRMDIWPNNKMEMTLSKGRHTFAASENPSESQLSKSVRSNDTLHILQNSRIILRKRTLGWRVEEVTRLDNPYN